MKMKKIISSVLAIISIFVIGGLIKAVPGGGDTTADESTDVYRPARIRLVDASYPDDERETELYYHRGRVKIRLRGSTLYHICWGDILAVGSTIISHKGGHLWDANKAYKDQIATSGRYTISADVRKHLWALTVFDTDFIGTPGNMHDFIFNEMTRFCNSATAEDFAAFVKSGKHTIEFERSVGVFRRDWGLRPRRVSICFNYIPRENCIDIATCHPVQ